MKTDARHLESKLLSPGRSRRSIRRLVFAMTTGLVLGWTVVTGQQPRLERVMILNSDGGVAKYSVAQDAFKSSLGAQTVEVNLAADSLTESQLRRRLQAESPSAIYCIGTKAFLLAGKAAKDRPVVMSSAINWERLPEHEKAMVIATELPAAAQLTMFRYFFPNVQRIGILYSREYNKEWMEQATAAAKDVGVEIVSAAVRRRSSVKGELKSLLPKVDALWITADPIVLEDEPTISEIFSQARASQKPVFAYSNAFMDMGAALMVSPDIPTIGRQAASMLESHAAGQKDADRVQSPAGSEVTLNMRVVKEYGLAFNQEAMDSVNKVIR